MSDLIRFIHKSPIGMNRIIKTFRTHWGAKISQISSEKPPQSPPAQPAPDDTSKLDITPKGTKYLAHLQEYESLSGISKSQLEKKIRSIAVKEVRLPITRSVWYVHSAVLKQYGLEQEDFTPLVQDTSDLPFLCEKALEPQVTPSSATKPSVGSPESGKTPGKGVKRKPNGVGKSLLQFLTPVGKTSLMPCTKRPKIMPSQAERSSEEDVIIVETNTTEPTGQDTAAEPVAKKPRLAVPSPTTTAATREVSTSEILQDSTNSLANKSLRSLLTQEPIIIM